MTSNISASLVGSLPKPNQGNRITYDSKQKGFGVRVTSAGIKSFVFNYTVEGRERRYTIGRIPEWTLARARERAKSLRQMVDQGLDPLQRRQDDRAAATIKDLWKMYETEHLPHLSPRAGKDVRSMWEKLILPELSSTKVTQLTSGDIDRLHRQIGLRTPVRANRVLEVLRKALNMAKRREWIDRNPADGFRRNPESGRRRYLTADEMVRFDAALQKLDNKRAVVALRLLSFTGARLREVLNAEWSQFDFQRNIWTKPAATTKQRRLHVVPISDAAATLIQSLADDSDGKYVFPNGKGGPLSDLKRPWRKVLALAKFKDVRIHDLRHTYASQLISEGVPLSVVGEMLGHTQWQTTQGYAHVDDNPLRKAANKVAEILGHR